MAYRRRKATTRRRSSTTYRTRRPARRTYSRRTTTRRRSAPRAQTVRIVLQQDPTPQLTQLSATGQTVMSVRDNAPKKAKF